MRSRHFNFLIAFIVAATLLTSAFVWVRLQIVGISYDIHELQSRERALREENNALSLKVHEARAPYRLESLARARFGMQAPRADQVVELSESE